MGGYLTHKGAVHPGRLEHFFYHLAVFEEEHFRRRSYEENEVGWGLETDNEKEKDDFFGTCYGKTKTPKLAKEANQKIVVETNVFHTDTEDTHRTASELRASDKANGSKAENKSKRAYPRDASRSYREFYYDSKLNISPLATKRSEAQRDRRAIARDYLEGLHWNLNYYHNGCCSWAWYFPHLYGPLSTDMVNLHEFYGEEEPIDIKDNDGFREFPFKQTEAFPPLAQLLSVLPSASANLLPPVLGELMLEPSSPLAQYYPEDFDSDANGKRQPWEAIVKIPFIDGDKLLEVVNGILEADEKTAAGELLSTGERRRNLKGTSHTFAPERDPNYVASTIDEKTAKGKSKSSSKRKATKKKKTKSRT